ncbi:cryptochrome/photolyase family protein [Devosia salina]|uniref:DNA photolyase family protein n=1 Tax=Devosia salina TaxID=2860336 RepID=A0ABX8WPB4_9HYPH|nr:deoxyribodipyrimidine photo-lyase [Devosia salina]QYO78260.1 DNA photolyase family protein [Devosia salina]
MSTALVWLRNDLRLADNPALAAACRDHDRVIALYIHETDLALRPIGAAARWWLHRSLEAMAHALAGIGVVLKVETGEAEAVLASAISGSDAGALHWNRRYGPAERKLDAGIKARLRAKGIEVASHPGNLLMEPWLIQTGQDKPYSVFTPFWKTLRNQEIARPVAAPSGRAVRAPEVDSGYRQPGWAGKLATHWSIGEAAAQDRLEKFLEDCVADYPDGRDFPGRAVTSKLSPHLRFGEISARQIWHAAQAFIHAHPTKAGAVDKFLSELAWRDFSYHQLYHRADIATTPMQPKYEDLKWRHAPAQLKAWQAGRTGIPIIDAGMRELWETGYMHNRVRMLTASFLTKNLLLDWRSGECWFWDTLVDADEANNPASWQWVAGCGLDAAPYFRIFNPVTQGERFDPEGEYVRRWVPELARLPTKFIHAPSEAPASTLKEAGVGLDETYPRAIADLKQTRQRALDAFGALSAEP